jgi:hypothetical protein
MRTSDPGGMRRTELNMEKQVAIDSPVTISSLSFGMTCS